MDGRVLISSLAFLMTILTLPAWAEVSQNNSFIGVDLQNGALPNQFQGLLNVTLPGDDASENPLESLENGVLPGNVRVFINGTLPGNVSDNIPMLDIGNSVLPTILQQIFNESFNSFVNDSLLGLTPHDTATSIVNASDDNVGKDRVDEILPGPLKNLLKIALPNNQFANGFP